MRQIIPFSKEINFKTNIKELTSISLDHDLIVSENYLIKGNLYLKGTYKILESNIENEKFSFKIPCEINVVDTYDLSLATIEIDDFNYDVYEDKLKIEVKLLLDNISKKEVIEPLQEVLERKSEEEKEIKEDKINDYSNIFNLKDDNYLTYYVYICQENDTIDTIIEKYKTTKYDLMEYNDIENIKEGSKIIIPTNNA